MHKNQQIVKTENFELSTNEYNAIKNEKDHYENQRALSIEALKIVQEKHGWVPDEAIYAISNMLNISPSEIESIATFYSGIFRQPVGRHIIRYCDSIVCYITGYKEIQIAIEQKLNIKPGQTTFDKRFTLLPTCCLGNCNKSPTIMINEDIYNYLTPEIIPFLLEQYK